MSRRKSVIATPEPVTVVLRRSARLSSLKNRDDCQKFGEDRVLVSGLEDAAKKSHRDLVLEVSKRFVHPLVDPISGAYSMKSPESNGSRDGFRSIMRSPRVSSSSSKPSPASSARRSWVTESRASHRLTISNDCSCMLRRSPRFASGGGTVGQFYSDRKDLGKSLSARCSTKSEKGNSSNYASCTLRRSPRFLSGGGSLDQSSSDSKTMEKSVFARCDKKSEKGKGKDDIDSSNRICTRRRSCILSDTKQSIGACDEGRVSVCPNEQKRRKSDKSFTHANGSCREDENAFSSLIFDSTREFTGDKRREIVLGLGVQTNISHGGTASSSMLSVVKADEEKRIRGDMISSRLEEGQLKMKNKLDGEGNCGAVQVWAKEQESALQNAYFTAKPSPNFWKKVSKLVPGKSAQECFDRVHSDLITPRQPQPRPRAKKTNLSPIPQFSLSASKLLKPTRPKANIHGHRRRNHLAKKTIRHLLEKQCHVDQVHGLDLFPVLEPTAKSYVPSTPTEKGTSFDKTLERSSSAHKNPRSRFTDAGATTLTSPPVLKQVKNKALHEKYIDQLHLREAKRKAESNRVSRKENIKPNNVQESMRAVKDSLIFDVKDAIEKLKGLEADDASSSSSELCYSRGESQEEEDETIYL